MDSGSSSQDSSPENRELASIIRELEGILPSGPEVDWEKLRRRRGEVLREIIKASPKSRRLAALIENSEYFVGGDEHHIIRVDSEPDRVYKVTHGDNFGCKSYFSPLDPELRGHFHGETNADPFFYLRRWLLLNSIGAYQSRFEGFVPSEKQGWLPRICISQPELPGANPTQKEIRLSLQEYGFVEVSDDAFFHPEALLLLTDAAPRNVRVIEGVPAPFDAIAWVPSGKVLEWCMKQCH